MKYVYTYGQGHYEDLQPGDIISFDGRNYITLTSDMIDENGHFKYSPQSIAADRILTPEEIKQIKESEKENIMDMKPYDPKEPW